MCERGTFAAIIGVYNPINIPNILLHAGESFITFLHWFGIYLRQGWMPSTDSFQRLMFLIPFR